MFRKNFLVFAWLGLAALFVCSVASAQTAGGACVSDEAKKTLQACQSTGKGTFDVTKHGKAPQVNFHSAPPPVDLKKGEQQKKPNTPMEAPPRDERKSRLQARARALLVTEINGLENLFKTTPQNAPDRVQLARRLAEDYVELESAAFRDKTTAEMARDNLKKTNPQGAGQQQTVANQANGIMLAARKAGIAYYSLMKNEYPNYGQIDEVLYYLAYEYEQASDNQTARKVYYELIQKKPDSKYIPNAYLAFAELFFNEAMGDPSKWDNARDAYKEVIKFPPDKGNKVFGYAWYKLAYVFWNKGEYDQALNAFKKTIDYGIQYSQVPNALKLAESARRDVIPVYALKGDPAAAYNFFHNISGDAGGTNEKTFKMMDDLGNNYLDTGHYPESIALFRDLLVRDKGSEKSCLYQGHITEATMAMKSGNKDVIKGELDNQLKTYNEFKASASHTPESKQGCANKTAELIAETAMAWHLEAVGSQGQRGTGDPKTMTLAAYLYDKTQKTWNQQEFATFTFPRIVKDDWPNIYKVKYAMADLLYFQKKWDQCGPAFDAVVAENPDAPEAPEAAYASVLCFQNIYDETHKGDTAKKGLGNLPGAKKDKAAQAAAAEAAYKPLDFTDTQKGMIQAFNRYICYIKPGASDTQGQEQLVEVKYARARTYFEAKHWEESGEAFRDIAMNHADRDVGVYASQLYLESINVMNTHGSAVGGLPRDSCFDDMKRDVPKFLELYCQGAKAKTNEEQCTVLSRIQADVLRLEIQRKIENLNKRLDQLGPSGSGAVAIQAYEESGTAYLDVFRRFCQTPLENNLPPQADKCEEIIYNAAKAFQAARLIAKSIAARMLLINPKYKLDKTALAKKSVYEIGGNFQAIAVYDQAAEWYERYACVGPKAEKGCDPKAEKAEQALSDAVLLRLGLGSDDDIARAIDDAKAFEARYGGAKAAQAGAIAFAIGAHYAEKEDWEAARKALTTKMAFIDAKAGIDIQVQAHQLLAKTYTKMKGEQGAKAEYERVRSLWKDPAAALKKINDTYKDEDDGARGKRLAKALTAVGEALFESAEAFRKATVDPVKFPVFHGSGKAGTENKKEVLDFVNTKVKDWMTKKEAVIVKAEAEYKKIVDLQPEPPPRWVIAAGSRVGLLWGDFVDDFRRAPYPADWDKRATKACPLCGFIPGTNGLTWKEVKDNYLTSLDNASQPYKDGTAKLSNGATGGAKPALAACLTYSLKYQYFDEFSRACEVWLARNYKSEYHVVDEIRGAPTLVGSGLDDKPPPLAVGGGIWHPALAAAAPDVKKDEPKKDEPKKDDKPAPKPQGAPQGKPQGKPGVLAPPKK